MEDVNLATCANGGFESQTCWQQTTAVLLLTLLSQVWQSQTEFLFEMDKFASCLGEGGRLDTCSYCVDKHSIDGVVCVQRSGGEQDLGKFIFE